LSNRATLPRAGYFRSLSVGSRYNRFLGAMSELPQTQLDHFIHVGEADRFTVIATMPIDGIETIVGEARYAFDADTSSFRVRLSVDDRGRPRHRFGIAQNSNARAAFAPNGCSAIRCAPTTS